MKARFPIRNVCRWLAILALLVVAVSVPGMTLLESKHNLSATGPGDIKAASEQDACIFCHSAHGSVPKTPLWNHASSGARYTPYTSTTLKAVVGQPTGSSRLCLSCHDGTVALGSVASRSQPIHMKNNVTTLPTGAANLGTDLSGDHPISFVYDTRLNALDPQLKSPAALQNRVKLDENREMQCISCHDPHDNRFGNFLVADNSGSALCVTCHTLKSWSTSIHNTSPARWNGQGPDPWPNSKYHTVAANACDNCHSSHKAGTKSRLLTAADEDQACYVCHSGTVARENIRAEFSKVSVHPVAMSASIHDASEDPINGPRHTSCVDCHDPHGSTPVAALAPAASGAIAGVKGMNVSGAVIERVNRQYELCLRCHADSPNRAPSRVSRLRPETNKRLQFSPSNRSFHPVAAVGKNPNVPSLITPFRASSMIYCTDCHNNDGGPGAGGNGPRGPHGSAYAPLLERQQVLTDFSPESAASYALCYKCHSRASILSNQSFPGHSSHIINYKTACTTCHDSHGVANNPGLINFNTTYVTPSAAGAISYVQTGPNSGNCTLTCHGSDHSHKSYNGPALSRRRPISNAPAH